MRLAKGLSVITGLVLLGCITCRGESLFDEEFELSVKAGRGQLSAKENQTLLKENHPLLLQKGDPGTFKLIENFAQLPDATLHQLKENTYLKWNYTDLDTNRQSAYRGIVQANIDMAKRQGIDEMKGLSFADLDKSQVGFAVVDIPQVTQKVVSVFVFWPELNDPTWVTVVNARAAGTPAYFQAHLQRLQLLKGMPTSPLPE